MPLIGIQRDEPDEKLDVVDAEDNVLQTLTKKDAYEGGHRVRIVSIAVVDPETGKIAVVRRGRTLSWQPLHYAISACGHVGAGETWEKAAQREMMEELGVAAPLRFIGKAAFDDTLGQRFMLGNFVAEVAHDALKPSAREVDDLFWMTPEEFRALLEKGGKIHNVLPPVAECVLAAL